MRNSSKPCVKQNRILGRPKHIEFIARIRIWLIHQVFVSGVWTNIHCVLHEKKPFGLKCSFTSPITLQSTGVDTRGRGGIFHSHFTFIQLTIQGYKHKRCYSYLHAISITSLYLFFFQCTTLWDLTYVNLTMCHLNRQDSKSHFNF